MNEGIQYFNPLPMQTPPHVGPRENVLRAAGGGSRLSCFVLDSGCQHIQPTTDHTPHLTRFATAAELKILSLSVSFRFQRLAFMGSATDLHIFVSVCRHVHKLCMN